MPRDPLDTWLERLTYGVALVRVLRGDKPEQVQADVERINAKAVQLKAAIEHMGEQRPKPKGDA